MVGSEELARMRLSYSGTGLDAPDLAATWLEQFERWFDEAVAAGVVEPNAMVLATSGPGGAIAARTVLAKEVDAGGVVFYTNYRSAKSRALDADPHAAVTFPWYELHRQVHLRGTVARVDRAATEAYWAVRPRAAQLGAWASPQSEIVADRAELDRRYDEVAERFGGVDGTRPIPAPPHWGGWCLNPETVEFWQGRTGRLHDRLRYRRSETGTWIVERLAP